MVRECWETLEKVREVLQLSWESAIKIAKGWDMTWVVTGSQDGRKSCWDIVGKQDHHKDISVMSVVVSDNTWLAVGRLATGHWLTVCW